MSVYTLLRNNPKPCMDDIMTAIEGNLCRCTGYRQILDGFRTFCGVCELNSLGLSKYLLPLEELWYIIFTTKFAPAIMLCGQYKLLYSHFLNTKPGPNPIPNPDHITLKRPNCNTNPIFDKIKPRAVISSKLQVNFLKNLKPTVTIVVILALIEVKN